MYCYLIGLDVIDKTAWSMLSMSYRGRDLSNEIRLTAVGNLDDDIPHSVIHTTDSRTYLRGNSSHLHLCEYLYLLLEDFVSLNHRRLIQGQLHTAVIYECYLIGCSLGAITNEIISTLCFNICPGTIKYREFRYTYWHKPYSVDENDYLYMLLYPY